MAYELARWRLTTCRYEQLTPPVARLAPPEIVLTGHLGAGDACCRGCTARERALSCIAPLSTCGSVDGYGRAGKPAGGASATIGPWDLIATRRLVVSE